MLIIPTRDRPKGLKKFIKAYEETHAKEHALVVFDKKYPDIKLPDNFNYIECPDKNCIEKLNIAFERFPNEDVYGFMADDIEPLTKQWDVMLRVNCLESQAIVWGSDGCQQNRLPTHPFICGDLVRKKGWFAHPDFYHNFVDNIWLIMAKVYGYRYLHDVKFRHNHPSFDKLVAVDKTYQRARNHYQDDKYTYEKIKNEFYLECLND